MPYSVDWFTPNIPHWETLLTQHKGKPNLRFLEIGCFEGRATVWLLEHVLTHPTSKITVIDPFTGSWEHKRDDVIDLRKTFEENIAPYKERVDILQGKSQDFFPASERNYFDFIYIDGSHDAIDVLRDAMASWDMLKSGGMILFDDFEWGDTLAPEQRPNAAIIGFIKTLGNLCSYQQYNDQVVVFKK